MDGSHVNLRLYRGDNLLSCGDAIDSDALQELIPLHPAPDPVVLADRELLRPTSQRHTAAGLVPFSAAWYDELEQKRYQRHGAWLPTALEFGRHPDESLLLLGPGLGSDAIRYAKTGTRVTVGLMPADYPDLVRDNIGRHTLPIRTVNLVGNRLPFADGAFDVVMWNALHDASSLTPARVAEFYRVLKANGKVIALFPAHYDAGYWQDLLLPLQWLYWKRPADPTTAEKTSARQLRRVFSSFHDFKVAKRHLRRSELPHPARILPLVFLERLLGRVLIFKAMKPLSARVGLSEPLAA